MIIEALDEWCVIRSVVLSNGPVAMSAQISQLHFVGNG